jgi:hypothetical protein
MINNINNSKDKKTTNDIIDLDNGSMIIYKENLNKYLNIYMCPDELTLTDYMWHNYGVIVKVIN